MFCDIIIKENFNLSRENTLQKFFEYAGNAFSGFTVLDFLEIVLLAVCVYYISVYIKKLNARWYNRFLFIFVLAGVILGVSELNMARTVFANMITIIVITTVVIFAQDIKRGVWKLSRPREKTKAHVHEADFSDEDLRHSAAEIIRATQNLAKKNVGALMIFSRTGLSAQIIESGVKIDAEISSQLIENLFFKNSPLHDGAVIFGDNTIISAGCFLPLSVELNIPKELGTRHRAAIGITEAMSDAVALVVSEETGIISMSFQGKVYRYLDTDQLTVSVEAAIGLRNLNEMPFLKTEKEDNNG